MTQFLTKLFFSPVIPQKNLVGMIVLFLVAVVLLPSNKIMFIFSAIFFVGIVVMLRSSMLAVIVAFLPFSLLRIGQKTVMTIIPAHDITSPNYPMGKSLVLFFSPFLVFLISALLTFLWELARAKMKKIKNIFHYEQVMYLITFLILSLSSVNSVFNNSISLFFFSHHFLTFCVLLTVTLWIKQVNIWPKISQMLNIILFELCLFSLFQVMVVIAQFITHAPLGLLIEESQHVAKFGLGGGESLLFFRPNGLYSHPNVAAYYLNQFLISIVIIEQYLRSKQSLVFREQWLYLTYLSALIAGIILQSRALYLSLGILFVLIGFWYRKLLRHTYSTVSAKFSWLLKLSIGIFVVVLSLTLISRLVTSIDYFSQGGGSETRELLFAEATAVLKKHLVWGTGMGNFVQANFVYHPRGVSQYFPEAVHNGLYLQLIETGFLVTMSFVITYILIINAFLKTIDDLYTRWAFGAGCLAQLTFAFFHPTNDFFSLYTFWVLVILYVETQKRTTS